MREPSLGELEAKARAGEQISLTDLAAAVKAEEKGAESKRILNGQTEKPSIRAQLDAAKGTEQANAATEKDKGNRRSDHEFQR